MFNWMAEYRNKLGINSLERSNKEEKKKVEISPWLLNARNTRWIRLLASHLKNSYMGLFMRFSRVEQLSCCCSYFLMDFLLLSFDDRLVSFVLLYFFLLLLFFTFTFFTKQVERKDVLRRDRRARRSESVRSLLSFSSVPAHFFSLVLR